MNSNFNLFDSYRILNPTGRDMTFFSKLRKKSEARLDRIYLHTSHFSKLKSSQILPFTGDHTIFSISFLTFLPILKISISQLFPNYLLQDENFIFSINNVLDKMSENETMLELGINGSQI